MQLDVDAAGAVGVAKDLSPHRLPPNAWTDARNMKFDNVKALRVEGYTQPASVPPIATYGLFPFFDGQTTFWLMPGLEKTYVFDGATYTNVTRQTASVDVNYTGAEGNYWNGGTLHGYVILNNGADVPQTWNPPYGVTKLADLVNWPSTDIANVVRPWRNFLIALDITRSSVRKPYLVKWSQPADPGTLPTSWDATDATKDAGETDLADTPDRLVDCAPMREGNIIYKESSTWGMVLSRNQYIFRFYPIYKTLGLLAQGCAIELEGKHFVVSERDIVIHDAANEPESLLETKLRNWFYKTLDPTHYDRMRVCYYPRNREVWVMFPELGNSWCNLALVYNLVYKGWEIREIPQLSAISYGPFSSDVGTNTWDADSGSWDSDVTRWGSARSGAFISSLLGASAANTKLYQFHTSQKADAVNYQSYLERIDVPLGPLNRDGRIEADGFETNKLVRWITPNINAPRGTVIKIYYGGRGSLYSNIIWRQPQLFRVGIDKRAVLNYNTPSLAVKFVSEAPVSWELEGYKVEYAITGKNFGR